LQLIENIHEADAEIAMTIRVLENY
jgi:hypothetical protein